MHDQHVCGQCGDPFLKPPGSARRSCGARCAGLAGHPGTVELPCPVCNKPLTISAQYAADATCSRSCARWKRLYPGRKRITACGRCGGPIRRPNINAVYCAARCATAVGSARREGRAFRIPRRFCLSCGGPLVNRTASALYCRRACQAIAGKERRAAKMAGARVERVYPIDIYQRDGWTCHLCSEAIDPTVVERYAPGRVSLDHVVPVSDPAFPGHLWENLAAAHLRCNIVKGAEASPADWALYRRLSALRAGRPIPRQGIPVQLELLAVEAAR